MKDNASYPASRAWIRTSVTRRRVPRSITSHGLPPTALTLTAVVPLLLTTLPLTGRLWHKYDARGAVGLSGAVSAAVAVRPKAVYDTRPRPIGQGMVYALVALEFSPGSSGAVTTTAGGGEGGVEVEAPLPEGGFTVA